MSLFGQADLSKIGKSKEKTEFSLSSLYTPQQLVELQTHAPEKYNQAISFFQEINALDPAIQATIDKRIMYRYYVQDRAAYNSMIVEIINQIPEQ